MKKLFFVAAVSMLLVFPACKKKVKTFAKVRVENAFGKSQSGVTVYMFDDDSGPGTTFFSPFYAHKKVVTESDGVATFDLQDVEDLDVVDTQTTLYFAVQRGSKLYHKGVTIRSGETKSLTITVP